MKTPAGSECKYFFGDYFRGRTREECRLFQSTSPPLDWQPKHCFVCPVPGILRANSCEHMQLRPSLERPFPFFQQRVGVKAFCNKTKQNITEPHIGCGDCHQLPEVFLGE